MKRDILRNISIDKFAFCISILCVCVCVCGIPAVIITCFFCVLYGYKIEKYFDVDARVYAFKSQKHLLSSCLSVCSIA
jgi:hypothetical protein